KQKKWTVRTCFISCIPQDQPASQKGWSIPVEAIWYIPNILLKMYFSIHLETFIGVRRISDGLPAIPISSMDPYWRAPPQSCLKVYPLIPMQEDFGPSLINTKSTNFILPPPPSGHSRH